MTGKYGARRAGWLAIPSSLLLSLACGPTPDGGNSSSGTSSGSASGSSAGSPGSGATGGTTGAGSGVSGGALSGASGSGSTSGSASGTSGSSGASAGSSSGMSSGMPDAGHPDSGPFVCPAMPVPGNCAPPVDIRCPYTNLKDTGCIDPNPFSDPKIPIKMASAVVPYEVNSPLWSDGAFKTRGMRLPNGGKIHVKDCAARPAECCVPDPITFKGCLPPADDGKWVFPVGTVMVKNFMFPDASRASKYKIVETRLFIHLDHMDPASMTDWVGYAYQWDEAQTNATILGGIDPSTDIRTSAMFHVQPTMGAAMQTITWNYPSRLDCVTCHTATKPSGGNTLGPETIQMNRTVTTVTGVAMNQIDEFNTMGLFETPPATPYKTALVAPYPGQAGSPPQAASLDERARSYLHANCSFCHRPDGNYSAFDVRYDVPLKSANICNATPGKGDLGVAGALLLTPMGPMSSVILLRMLAPPGNAMIGKTGRMPAIASQVVDTQATDLMSKWIASITACP